jgi:hypothetical protein
MNDEETREYHLKKLYELSLRDDPSQRLVQKISYDPDGRVITIKYKGKSISTFKNDLRFLINLGDSEMGFVIRGEIAEMYGVPLEEIDDFVLTKNNGDELD